MYLAGPCDEQRGVIGNYDTSSGAVYRSIEENATGVRSLVSSIDFGSHAYVTRPTFRINFQWEVAEAHGCAGLSTAWVVSIE
jgi:hypothetical protein